MINTCPLCCQSQHSEFDQVYLNKFKRCWSCDKESWSNGSMSLETFEQRELEAYNVTNYDTNKNTKS